VVVCAEPLLARGAVAAAALGGGGERVDEQVLDDGMADVRRVDFILKSAGRTSE
jgi:hypothetical protein